MPAAVSSVHENERTANAMKLLRTAPASRISSACGDSPGATREFCRGLPAMSMMVVMQLLAGQAALAQTDAERLEALRACLDIESDAARLLCFESIVSAQATATEAPGGPVAETAADEAAGPEAERGEATAVFASGDDLVEAVADERERTRPANAEPAAEDARAADVTGERRRDSDRSREAEAPETIVVVEAGRGTRGNAIFVTDDGRRFQQTSGNTARALPLAPFEATLEDGAFGSVFLVARAAGLRVRVREQTE